MTPFQSPGLINRRLVPKKQSIAKSGRDKNDKGCYAFEFKEFDAVDKIDIHSDSIFSSTQQNNGYDCGLFVCR
jgi:hypothetical protein